MLKAIRFVVCDSITDKFFIVLQALGQKILGILLSFNKLNLMFKWKHLELSYKTVYYLSIYF